jgi:cyclophilin family peptidyl-prolyl cis-trans isomerase
VIFLEPAAQARDFHRPLLAWRAQFFLSETGMAKYIPFISIILIIGCGGGGGSSEDAIIKRQIELNKAAASELAQVKDITGLNELLISFTKKRDQNLEKAASLPKDKIRDFLRRYNTECKESLNQLDQAVVDFYGRLNQGKNYPQVLMETSMGPIKIELFEDLAPITVKNFLQYVDDKFYDGTIFHRVIADFMIQGGGFEPDMKEKAVRPAIKNESDNKLANHRATLAMARTDEPNSATAQFFINVKDNSFLNKAQAKDGVGYAVFGRVMDGMDVVDKIKVVTTDRKDAPLEDVVIKSVRRVDKKK